LHTITEAEEVVDINREEMMLNAEKIEIEMHHSFAINVAKKVIWHETVQVVDLLLMMTDAPVVEVIMQTEAAEMHPDLIHVLNAVRRVTWQENVQMKKKQTLVEKV
jgi:hypothetical protein